MVKPWREWMEEEKRKWVDSFSDTMVEALMYLSEHNIPISKMGDVPDRMERKSNG